MPTSNPQPNVPNRIDKGGDAPSLRMIYAPAGWSARPAGSAADTGTGRDRIRRLIGAGIDYYRDRMSLLVVAVTVIVMCYGGGLVLFWFHSIALNKGGPAIAWYTHWLIDSSVALVALGPVLLVVLPVSTWAADRLARWHSADSEPAPWRTTELYVLISGVMFAAVSGPGPLVHDALIGAGTPLAEQVTAWFGDPAQNMPQYDHYAAITQVIQQWGAGIAVYPAMMALTVFGIRAGLSVFGGAGGTPRRSD